LSVSSSLAVKIYKLIPSRKPKMKNYQVKTSNLLAQIGLNSGTNRTDYYDHIIRHLTSPLLYQGDNDYLKLDARSVSNSIGSVQQLIEKRVISLDNTSEKNTLWSEYSLDKHQTIYIPQRFNSQLLTDSLLTILEICYYYHNAHFLNTWLNQTTSFSEYTIDSISIRYGNGGCEKLLRILEDQSSISQDWELYDSVLRLYAYKRRRKK
ncbi:MAG: hypothetical protein ACRCXZ_06890, partial [Patescibacteria group bacterium]